jgi:hypothetical protein
MTNAKGSDLSALAARVKKDADLCAASAAMATCVSQLRERSKQLSGLCQRAREAAKRQAELRSAGLNADVAKTQVKPRVTALRNLEAKIATDISVIFDRDAFNLKGLTEALTAAEASLMEKWRVRVAPPKESSIIEALEFPEIEAVVQKLKRSREALQRISTTLPEKVSEIKKGMAQRDEFDVLLRKLVETGLDRQVLAFLEKARTDKGVSLAEVLEETKVMHWLRQHGHAARFNVTASNRSQIFKR